MKRRYVVLASSAIILLLLALWPLDTPSPGVEHQGNRTIISYPFDRIDSVAVSNGVIVRSGGTAYLVRKDSTRAYRIGSGKIVGAVGEYIVTYLNYKVHVKRANGLILNDKWSKSLKLGSSVAVGRDFIVTAEHDDRELKVNVLFYFPESGKKKEYSFRSDRKGTAPRAVANGEYAVVGVPYTWRLYYFKDGELLWEGSLPVECGYGDYPYFTVFLNEDGSGYVISSEGYAVGYFNSSGFGTIGLNRGYCLSFAKEPPENLTVVRGAAVFDGCVALMTYMGEGSGLYFYRAGRDYYAENFTFKADFTTKVLAAGGRLLALYRNHTSLFNCTGEVLRVEGRYDEAYPLADGFLLVRYEGDKTLLHIIPSGETYELEGARVVGTIDEGVVGIKGNRVLLLKLQPQ